MRKLLLQGAFVAVACVVAVWFLNSVTPAFATERPVVANQRKSRLISFQMTDTAGPGNAVITIGSGEVNVTDSATGTYVFSIVKPFFRTPVILCGDASSATAPNAQCTTASQTNSGFRLYCADGDSLGTLINPSAVNCIVNGWDAGSGAL